MCRHQILTLSGASTVTNGELNRGERGRSANWHSFASSRSFDEGVRIGHKRNEHSIFGKTNPIRADEGSIKVTSTGAASIGSAGAGACTTEAGGVRSRENDCGGCAFGWVLATEPKATDTAARHHQEAR